MARQRSSGWSRVALGILAGLTVYSGALFLSRSLTSHRIADADEASELDAYFTSQYKGATGADLARALDERTIMLRTLHDDAVERLIEAGRFEFLCADPSTHKVSLTRPPATEATAVRFTAIDPSAGVYQKVTIPRGFDPEFDLLLEECTWLKARVAPDSDS